ncbi:MAG: hypothetical protein WCX61_01805 [Candidatus Peribacteraceae bacterium]|jgi:hypothetical protein
MICIAAEKSLYIDDEILLTELTKPTFDLQECPRAAAGENMVTTIIAFTASGALSMLPCNQAGTSDQPDVSIPCDGCNANCTLHMQVGGFKEIPVSILVKPTVT